MTDALRIRPAVRALVISPRPSILLVRFEFPTGTRWALPGGGLEAGEDHLTALRRELAEEVGLVDVPVGPHIWTREHIVPFVDGRWDGQREHVHAVHVDHEFEPRPALSWQQLNDEFLHEIRWWTIDELLAASHIVFAPRELPRLARHVVEEGTPSSPIDIAP